MNAGNRPDEILKTAAEVDRLQTQFDLLTAELKKIDIVAEIDGVEVTPYVERLMKGTRLYRGDEVMHLVNSSVVRAEMLVSEREMEDVHLGQDVWMRMNSFPTRDFKGTVDFISPVVQTDGQQIVRAVLKNEDGVLKRDMTGVAKIYGGDYRVIGLMTRRIRRWVNTEFWDLLP